MSNRTITRTPRAVAEELVTSWRAQRHNSYDKYVAAAAAYYDTLRGPSSPRDPGYITMLAAQKDAQRSLKTRYSMRLARARKAEAHARTWRTIAYKSLDDFSKNYYSREWAHARAELAHIEDAIDHLVELTGLRLDLL